MKWESFTDATTQQSVLRQKASTTQKTSVMADPTVAASLAKIQQQAGWLEPDTKLALAKANASQEAVDKAGELGARRLVDRNDPLAEDDRSFWHRNIYPKIKAASRWTMAALDFVPETAQGAVAQLFDDNDDIDGWFKSTKLGTMFEDSDKAGQGFFLGGEAEQLQAERARKYRGTINGSAFTLGRAAASRLFLPNSKPYNIMSGVIDAAVLIRLDPTGPLTKGVSKLRLKGLTVGDTQLLKGYQVPIQSVEEAAALSTALRTESGLRNGTDALDQSQWLRFMQSNRRSRALVDRIWSNSLRNVDEVDELTRQTRLADGRRAVLEAEEAKDLAEARFNAGEIGIEEYDTAIGLFRDADTNMKTISGELVESANDIKARKTEAVVDLFTDKKTGKLRVSVETINELLDASNKDEILGILSPQWVAKSGSLPEDIRRIQGIGGTWVDRIPLNSIRKSRLFTQVPGSKIVLGGNDLDNREAVSTVVNWSRTLGMGKKEQQRLLTGALRVFTGDAVRSDQNAFIDFFYSAIGNVLVKNGVDKQFVDLLQEDGKRFADVLRLYYADIAGKPTDSNFWSWLKNSDLAADPDDIKRLIDEKVSPDGKLTIQTPLTMVESLNRVVYLPDVREMRRLTRSRMVREAINEVTEKNPQKFSAALFTKTTRETKQVLVKQAQIDEAQKALTELAAKEKELLDRRFVDQTTETYRASRDEALGVRKQMAQLEGVINDLRKEGYVDEVVELRRGDLRGPLALMEWYQQSLWKPLALATGGYVMRNTIDAQIRMALSGFASIVNHPFKYIALVTGRNSRGSLLGDDLLPRLILPDGTVPKDGLGGIIQKIRLGKYEHVELSDELMDEMSFGLRKMGLWDQSEARVWETNNWQPVSAQQNRRAWLRGLGQNGEQINKDAAMQAVARVVYDAYVQGVTDPRAIRGRAAAAVVEVVNNEPKYFNNIRRALEEGVTVRDPEGNSFVWKTKNWDDVAPEEIDSLLEQWAYRMIVDRVQLMGGGQNSMHFMYAYNAVPKTVKGEVLQPITRGLDEIEGRTVGDVVQLGEGDWAVVIRVDGPANSATLQQIVSSSLERGDQPIQAFVNRDLSFAARTQVEQMPISYDKPGTGLPGFVKYENIEYDETDPGKLASFQRSMDSFTDWFFGRLYASVTTKLDRSPVFRQAYYTAVAERVDQLSVEAALTVRKNVRDGAKRFGMKEHQYVGSRDLWAKIQASAKRLDDPANPFTAEDLDDYAKWVALDQVKGLLYNASSRNNLEDSLRIVAPFAVAWREILGTYGQFLVTNPVNTYRQFQRVYTGLEGADPENDGRGFIYNDPVSGKPMFKFPFSGVLARALTGTSAELEAPITQLSQGISVIPALGPYGQIAVSQLPDQPQYDDIIEFLLPYGRTEDGNLLFNATPGWVRKALETLEASTTDQASLFYNTYIETVRAKAASGAYDLADAQDKQRLLDDSRSAARILMAMRTASQFFGPTAATAEFQVPTKEGDQYVSLLISEFYKLQAEDYDTAVPTFLETYGDDAFVYAAGKTRALREGLEATAEFGEWERQNQDLLGEYADVAAYLAPSGSDFSFAVWQRQVMTGEREKLTDRELLLLAQERVGSAKYRSMRLKAGPYPSDEVRDLLRRYRESLAKQYPGFPAVAQFEVGKFEGQMVQLRNMVDDPRTQGNNVAEAVRTYLGYRDALLGKAREGGYVANTLKQTKGLQSLRDFLASIGNQLIKETPEFARIYDRLLAQEVEL
jgi:hypothetical protein